MKHTIARSIALLLIFVITLLPPQSSYAQQGGQTNPRLLKNINAAESEGSSPLNFMPVGDVTYFFAKQGEGEYELWKTDGTPGGTTLVKADMNPGLNSYALLNNFLYYPAKDIEHGEELWRTNLATDETGLFADIEYGEYSSGPNRLTEFEGKIYFSANWGRFQFTDGTLEGTTHNGLTGERVDSGFMEYQDSLYYSAYQWNPTTDEDSVFLRWFGPGGLGVTYDLTPGKPLIIYKDRLYFTASRADTGMELWSTAGTLESIQLLRDTHPGDTYVYYTAAVYNDLLYFVTLDDTNVNELWVTNGTEAGTTKVTNLPEEATALQIITALPSQGTENLGGLLLSINQGGDENHKLWRFDGTDFTMLADLRRFEPEDEFESEFGLIVDGIYYFHAWDPDHGVELWRTDGTPAGTFLVKDIQAGAGNSMASRFTSCGDSVCFAADDGVHGKELWKTDGTSTGTILVKDINIRPANAYPDEFIPAGSYAYFLAEDSISTRNLWRTDGTPDGTYPLNLDPSVTLELPVHADGPTRVMLGSSLIFAADDSAHGVELWKSDGTPEGTQLLKDLIPGEEDSFPDELIRAGDKIFFETNSRVHGTKFWQTDGTKDGTTVVPGITPYDFFAAYGNRAVVNIYQSTTSTCELWLTGGTSAGVKLADDLCMRDGAEFNGKLYFSGQRKSENPYDLTLWETNGTPSGTKKVMLDLSPGGYYEGFSITQMAATNTGLYVIAKVSDGEFLLRIPSGGGASQFVKAFYNINGVPATVYQLIGFGNQAAIRVLMYTEEVQRSAMQLWTSDGSKSGTRRVAGTYTGPGELLHTDSFLYFTAFDPTYGTQVWSTSGTNLPAKRVTTYPQTFCAKTYTNNRLALLNGSILLPLDDANTNPPGDGCELWAYQFMTTKLFLPSVGR